MEKRPLDILFGNYMKERLLLLVGFWLLISCTQNIHPSNNFHSFFSEKSKYETYFNTANLQPSSEDIKGMILPHHLVFGNEVANYYNLASKSSPSVIVLIGPDHFSAGNNDITSSDISHETPYGILKVNTEITNNLYNGIVSRDDHLFNNEHSITSQTGFIKKIFPRSTVVPLAMYKNLSRKKAIQVAEELNAILPKDFLVIASVDFSHFLPEEVSRFHDEVSTSMLKNLDNKKMSRIDADCPSCLITFSELLSLRSITQVVENNRTSVLANSNEERISENTTHLYMAFTEGAKIMENSFGINFFGDLILDRGVEKRLSKNGTVLDNLDNHFDFFLYGTDLNVFNLEGVVTKKPCEDHAYVCFRHNGDLLFNFLRKYPFDIATFQNNHIFDAGNAGIKDTKDFFAQIKTKLVGLDSACSKILIRESRISICAFDDSHERLSVEKAKALISNEKKEANRIIVSIHWGREYSKEPSNRQIEVAKSLALAGADVIIGHHPHVVQKIDIINGSLVFYSLGDFLFDQTDISKSSGLSVGIYFNESETVVYLYPLETINANPKLLIGTERKNVIQSITKDVLEFADKEMLGRLEIPNN